MADVEALVEEIAQAEAMRDHYANIGKDRRAELAEQLEVGKHAVGDFDVNVIESRRFDPKKAKAVLTEEELGWVSDLVPVAAKVKAMFEDDYELMTNQHANVIRIKRVED